MFSIKESKKRISRTKDPLNVISRKASGLTIDSHAWGKCLGAAFPVKSIAPVYISPSLNFRYDSMSDLGEIRVYQRADFQSGSRVLKKVF